MLILKGMESTIPKPSILINNNESQKDSDSNDLSIEKSQWMSQFLTENPQILSLRERILPYTGGYSFSNIINAATTASLTPINRFIILQLIYNHLYATGMFQTAEMMKKETGLKFQIINQSWQRTHLMILISLGILPYENQWNIQKEPLTDYVEEYFDEDNLSFDYKEDPKEIFQEFNDQNSNAVFDSDQHDFRHLITCSLRRLIVLLIYDQSDKFQNQQTKSKQEPKTNNFFITENDLNGLFLTLHSITTSKHFLDHLISIFHLTFPDDSSFSDQNLIKISVIKLIESWVLYRGLFLGNKTIKLVKEFIETVIKSATPLSFSSQTDSDSNFESFDIQSFLTDFIQKINHLKSGNNNVLLTNKVTYENPIIRDPQLMFKPGLKFLDVDAMEVARQITLIAHLSFQKVHSREIMNMLLHKKWTKVFCPLLNEFFQFLRHFSQLAIEAILTSSDKNDTFSRLIEITSNLESLFNYQAVSELLTFLLRADVLSIVEATQGQIGSLKELHARCGDVHECFADYSSAMLRRHKQRKPAIPNFNAEIREANISPSSDFLNGLINIEKRRIIGEKLTLFYDFQNTDYNFIPVKQIQKTLLAAPSLSSDGLENTIFKLRLKANGCDF